MAEQQGEEPRYPPNAIHLVRTTQMAHYQLSAMADHKASLLMAATFAVFTIAVGKGVQSARPPLPLIILAVAAFFSAICAVSAVLPAIRPRKKAGGSFNILFFGAFTQLGEEEFIDEVTARMRSDDSIYRTMARDIYQNGCVLQHKKYKLLGWAYRIFLAGLVLAFAAFILEVATGRFY